MSYFFLFFYEKMKKVACAILTITNKDFVIHFDNSNLLLGKSAIQFESLAQKKESGRQTTGVLYY